jgi:predicted O-methyltransferase YrrM
VDWDIYNACRAALNEGRAEHALHLVQSNRNPDSPIWSTLACLEAECLSALGRYAESARLLEETAVRDPRNHWLFYNLAKQYRELGEHAKALEATRRTHLCLGWDESLRNGYTFTHDYFAANIADWTRWFAGVITAAPIRCLEIGSWQGGSATWLLDKVVGPRGGSLTCIDTFEGSSEHAEWLPTLGESLESIFDRNIARTGHGELCQKLVGASQDVLVWLRDERFDFIYVDGAHEAKYVIQDAVLCWPLVRPGGFLLFDDTHFRFRDRPEQDTQTAIAAFRRWFADEMEVLTPDEDRQMLVRKRGQ